MTKFLLAFQATFWLGYVLGDAGTGFELQMAFLAGYGLVRLVPGRVWRTLGEAFLSMDWFWLLFWSSL